MGIKQMEIGKFSGKADKMIDVGFELTAKKKKIQIADKIKV